MKAEISPNWDLKAQTSRMVNHEHPIPDKTLLKLAASVINSNISIQGNLSKMLYPSPKESIVQAG
jgi:hypothetical protein